MLIRGLVFVQDGWWWPIRLAQLSVQLQHVRFLKARGLLIWIQVGALCRTDDRTGLHGFRDVVGGLENKEGLAALAQLHGVLLLCAVDLELDLLLRRSEKRELAEADVEGRTRVGAIFLLDDDHINGAAESGRVDRIPCGRNRIS